MPGTHARLSQGVGVPDHRWACGPVCLSPAARHTQHLCVRSRTARTSPNERRGTSGAAGAWGQPHPPSRQQPALSLRLAAQAPAGAGPQRWLPSSCQHLPSRRVSIRATHLLLVAQRAHELVHRDRLLVREQVSLRRQSAGVDEDVGVRCVWTGTHSGHTLRLRICQSSGHRNFNALKRGRAHIGVDHVLARRRSLGVAPVMPATAQAIWSSSLYIFSLRTPTAFVSSNCDTK
jgi:hypothetical protein